MGVLRILYSKFFLTRLSTCKWYSTFSCSCHQGNNGLSGFNFGPSQFQNLLYLAGYDPSQPPFTAPCSSGTDCVLPYLGRVRDSACEPYQHSLWASLTDMCLSVNSIVLLTNGISFALQAVVLLLIGSWADYGTWR